MLLSNGEEPVASGSTLASRSARAALRDGSADLHAAVEVALATDRLVEPDVYHRFLQRMEAVGNAVEQATRPHLAEAILDPLRGDLARLRLDLLDLSAARARPSAAPDLRIAEPAEAWGAIYVMEGARLGGRIIARRAAASFGISADFGGRYLHDDGEPAGVRWRRFLAQLEGALTEIERRERALGATRRTFALFF